MAIGPLAQGRGPEQESFAQHADGLLLVANGIDSVLRWDGLTDLAETAGVVAPTVAPTLTASGVGTISGQYFAYTRWLDRYRNVSNLSPLGGPITATAKGTITYTNVQAPTDPKVVTRQILRNTAGQTAVFYVDVETTNLALTTFASTKTDTLLQAEEAVSLLDEDSRPLANLHGVPPTDRSVVAAHLDRMFLAGENVVTKGSVALTSGSPTVTGAGTGWRSTLAGRFLWVSGATKPYEILSVDATNQTLTLTENYAGTTNPYALYAIRPALPRRRIVQFSEAGLPESWPATNAISVQEDSDEITALMPMGSFIYILCRRNTYRLTFQESPLKDGFVFFANARGCVNHRCWALAGDSAFLMDEQGCYFMGASGEVEEISGPIQDLFETSPLPPGLSNRPRIQWSASRHFHAVWEPVSGLMRWFVTLSGQGRPRHALVFDAARKGWWLEEYPWTITSSTEFRLANSPRIALGGPRANLLLQGQRTLDLVSPQSGTVRGVATSASPTSLTDTLASFSSSLVGAPLVIVDGEGRGQQRIITQVSSTTLTIDVPWTKLPDATSAYQCGGISWRYRTGWFRFAENENENPRRLEITFQPTLAPCTLDARLYYDRSTDPVEWGSTYSSDDASGFSSEGGSPYLVANLAKLIGFVQRRLDGKREHYLDGPRFLQVELAGVSNQDLILIHGIRLDGVNN